MSIKIELKGEKMILRNSKCKILLLGLLFLGAANLSIKGCSSSGKKQSNMVVLADLPMLDDPYYIVIPVTINSRQYRFIIDTASGNTIVDSKLKSLLGDFVKKEKRPVTPKQKQVDFEFYNFPKQFEIGSLNLKGTIACFDLCVAGLPPDYNYDGIIGMNLLYDEVLQLDIENKCVRLLRWRKTASQNTEDFRQKWGHPVQIIKNEAGWPQINLNLTDTITELFLVDTGLSAHNRLRESTFDKLKGLDGIEYYKYSKQQMGALVREQGLSLINPSDLEETEVVFISQAPLPGIDLPNLCFEKKHVSILGIKFVRLFKMMTFDFKNSRLYLKPVPVEVKRYKDTGDTLNIKRQMRNN